MRHLSDVAAIKLWYWWFQELRGLWPFTQSGDPVVTRNAIEICIASGGTTITDISVSGRKIQEKVLHEFHSFEGLTAANPAKLSLSDKKPILLSVRDSDCFVHKLEIPVRALPRATDLLKLELARLTPFVPSDILTGWREHRGERKNTNTTVSHYVLRADLILPVAEWLKKSGLSPSGAFVRPHSEDPVTLQNPRLFPENPSKGRWRMLAVASCVAAAVCGFYSGWEVLADQARLLSDLEAEIGKVQKNAVSVRRRIEAIEASSQRISALMVRKNARPDTLAIWEELTKLLPDSAWLESLSIDGKTITIDGSAASAEQLISILDASSLFDRVAFTGPVTKSGDNGTSRFAIRMSLEGPVEVSSRTP